MVFPGLEVVSIFGEPVVPVTVALPIPPPPIPPIGLNKGIYSPKHI
jgi:hypothetical protein